MVGEEQGEARHGGATPGLARIKERGAAYHAHNERKERKTEMRNNQTFLRGIPTKIDVDKLTSFYGVPKEGEVIRMEDAADKIGLHHKSNRFLTVFKSWRKMLFREHNLLSVGTGDGAISFADPTSRIEYAAKKVKTARTLVGRAVVIAHGTDTKRLSSELQKTQKELVDMNNTRLRLAVGVMK